MVKRKNMVDEFKSNSPMIWAEIQNSQRTLFSHRPRSLRFWPVAYCGAAVPQTLASTRDVILAWRGFVEREPRVRVLKGLNLRHAAHKPLQRGQNSCTSSTTLALSSADGYFAKYFRVHNGIIIILPSPHDQGMPSVIHHGPHFPPLPA